MQQGINIETVKQYNASLREYKEKSAKLRAELEFNEQELNRQCAELSKELGREVTPDNIEEIMAERTAKIQNTIEIGTEILNRIKAEEAGAVGTVAQTAGTAPQAAQPLVGTLPMMSGVPSAPVAPAAPAAPTAPTAPGFPDMAGDLPPMFAGRP